MKSESRKIAVVFIALLAFALWTFYYTKLRERILPPEALFEVRKGIVKAIINDLTAAQIELYYKDRKRNRLKIRELSNQIREITPYIRNADGYVEIVSTSIKHNYGKFYYARVEFKTPGNPETQVRYLKLSHRALSGWTVEGNSSAEAYNSTFPYWR